MKKKRFFYTHPKNQFSKQRNLYLKTSCTYPKISDFSNKKMFHTRLKECFSNQKKKKNFLNQKTFLFTSDVFYAVRNTSYSEVFFLVL